MKHFLLGLALVAAPFALHAQDATGSADAALRALYQDYWAWQVREYGWTEKADGSVEQGAMVASATAEAQRARAAKAADVRVRLDKIDRAQLSPAEKVNAAVLRAALTETIEDARFARMGNAVQQRSATSGPIWTHSRLPDRAPNTTTTSPACATAALFRRADRQHARRPEARLQRAAR